MASDWPLAILGWIPALGNFAIWLFMLFLFLEGVADLAFWFSTALNLPAGVFFLWWRRQV